MIQAPGTISWWLPQSPINPDPCGTFSWPTSKSPSPLFFPAKSLLLPKPHGKKEHPRATWSSLSSLLQNRVVLLSLSMAAMPRFKSQCQSSFAAQFPTPPTFSYTCQHPHILPALLGCHSKSGQTWPHGMEPVISRLSYRPCNQGELLPSPILDGIHSHPPGSKHGHSYLTYL